MTKVNFVIYGDPIGWKSPKTIYNRKNKSVIGKRMHEGYRNFSGKVHDIAVQKIQEPMHGPLVLIMKVFLKRPKNMIWKTRPMPAVPHEKVGDLTNFEKGIEDALEGIAYLNDGQIAGHITAKWYCAGPGHGDERPRAEITIIGWNEFAIQNPTLCNHFLNEIIGDDRPKWRC